jgi:uncharacterized membrane protein YphA (DoxX/SURF4 family)
MSEKLKTNVFVLSRIILGLVFLVSGYLKAMDIQSFAGTIYKIQFFTFQLAYFTAIIIVGLELLLGLFLVSGLYLNHILKVSFILLSAFTIFLLFVLVFDLQINCNCFGSLSKKNINSFDVLRNIIILSLNYILIKCRELSGKYSLDTYILNFSKKTESL